LRLAETKLEQLKDILTSAKNLESNLEYLQGKIRKTTLLS